MVVVPAMRMQDQPAEDDSGAPSLQPAGASSSIGPPIDFGVREVCVCMCACSAFTCLTNLCAQAVRVLDYRARKSAAERGIVDQKQLTGSELVHCAKCAFILHRWSHYCHRCGPTYPFQCGHGNGLNGKASADDAYPPASAAAASSASSSTGAGMRATTAAVAAAAALGRPLP